MGVPVTKNNILISSDALVSHLKHSKPGARLFVLGTPELKATIKEGGFTLTSRLEDETDLVVVGFDQTLTYETLTIACRLIDRGVPYIATHPDVRCPIEGGEYIPDTGAFLACIKTATGKDPEYITGKPYGYMVDTVMERTGLKKEEIAMVGDRLMTDIRFSFDFGADRGSNTGRCGAGTGETGYYSAPCERDIEVFVTGLYRRNSKGKVLSKTS